ncbi:LysR substrate-binding domain-containing protein [Basilea psittacipulmonis]|uniref:LysR family transcriptional regulator n=1 Tax=Basilea psittacipulmonis DSM 24701 TaxID=1072685 RepID=A0A077DHU7_9BURK|nr:LysR substrate-binding domain-containing protein [Basilea psittacipulmonis]AIL32708.1 LysR family transcriptional regulator [Basilea psittacipulmonis DSM 24701]
MTLTELKYIIAVAKERHFGKAADSCFVSQPTLSIAIKKLEDELGVVIFERGPEISVTDIGKKIIEQAHKIMSEVNDLKALAKQGQNPLVGSLKLAAIYTIAPYLLPYLIPIEQKMTPEMPLVLSEGYTADLLVALKSGELDCAILALPIEDKSLEIIPLYDEAFVAALPAHHPLAHQDVICMDELKNETLLMLGPGHCFRDQVLEYCPENNHYSKLAQDASHTLEGSSLETIRHMVATGLGYTILPLSATYKNKSKLLSYISLKPNKEGFLPKRTVALVCRQSFIRKEAVYALAKAIKKVEIEGLNFFPTT